MDVNAEYDGLTFEVRRLRVYGDYEKEGSFWIKLRASGVGKPTIAQYRHTSTSFARSSLPAMR